MANGYARTRRKVPSTVRPLGGIARELRIKVGNMEPACCECNHGGIIADTLFLKRLSLTGRFERVSAARQREENE